MEELRNRINVQLVNKEKTVHENQATCRTKYLTIIYCYTEKQRFINKLAYIGMCVLELSKVLIYRFHYDYVKNKYFNKSKLLFKDTHSLCMKLRLKMSMKVLAAIMKF